MTKNFPFSIFHFPFFFASYLIVILGLFLYSYTQVDLNLTLSQWSVWQVIQKWFQHIGWFQRPLSTVFYVLILLLLTIHYFLFLWLAKKNKLSISQFWRIVIPASIILLFSYNAFSYDLFNYMFDARTVTYHNLNPYEYKALDFPKDPWIHFMRWTHRTYPYGPIWLWLTVPLSFIGMQFFLPTLFLFKTLMAVSFLGATYYIGKILEKISPENKMFGMAFFTFNPLVIIESLVSAHHDIVMMFFAVFAFFLLLQKRYIFAFMLLFLSIGIKFATVFLLPVFLLIFLFQIKQQKINWEKFFLLASILMITAVVAASIRTNFQPWYLLYVLPFAAIIARKYYILIPSIVISIFSLLIYVPFLYLGNWDPPVPNIILFLMAGAVTLSIAITFVYALKYKGK